MVRMDRGGEGMGNMTHRLTCESRLTASQLPAKDNVVLLVEEFFTNVHSLRCFGFIHKPSYMEQLNDESYVTHQESPLLHTICAIGAK